MNSSVQKEKKENGEQIPLLSDQSKKDFQLFSIKSIKTFPFYLEDVQNLESLLMTNLEKGLTDQEIEERRNFFGENELPKAHAPSSWKIFLRQFYDVMVLILLAASLASAAIQDFVEAAVLLVVVLSNVIVGFFQEKKAEKTLEALQDLTVPYAQVIRNGETVEVPSSSLVIGDIAILEEGDQVPADIRIVSEANLQAIESQLTGESEPVNKTVEKPDTGDEKVPSLPECSNLLFMSTYISKGHAKGIVIKTGLMTEIGKVSKSLTSKRESTPLQKRLSVLGKVLVVLSIVLCALVSAIGILRKYINYSSLTQDDIIYLIKVGVSLAVSVIPEGLIAVMTLTMALGVQRMARRNTVVRKLPVVETLGSITIICTDKTGTLTEGRMRTKEFWVGGIKYELTGKGLNPQGEYLRDKKPISKDKFPKALNIALMICALCNNSTIQKDEETQQWESFGDPTEVALEVASMTVNLGKEKWEKKDKFCFEKEYAFDSERKRMSVIYSKPEENPIMLTKGATESIINLCKNYLDENDDIKELDEEKKSQIIHKGEELSIKGYRVLALSYRILSQVEETENPEDVEKEMTFIGLVGMQDPPREEAKETIQAMKEAGVRVCMITGDNPKTAFNISCQLGITKEDEKDLVFEGHPDTTYLSSVSRFPLVFARVSPRDKYKIVDCLKKRDEVTAMLGDGVNDAPAIQRANAGIAMGRSGSDLAKEAAHIILTDDDFNTILSAIEEGRRTFDNIKKFIIYLLSCNSSEIYVMLTAVIVGLPVPFTAVMILWANLVVDVPPALALGIDPPEKDLLKRKPRDPKSGIFTKKTVFLILYHGFFMASITLGLFCFTIYGLGYEISDSDHDKPNRARGIAFLNMATLHLVHSFLSQSAKETVFSATLYSNKWLIRGFLFSMILLVVVCYVPYLNTLLNQYPLNWFDWALIMICVIIHIASTEIVKFFLRRTSKSDPNELFYRDV